MSEVEYAANEAVFGLQLSWDKAVSFVVRNAKTDKKTARAVLKEAMTSYKLDNKWIMGQLESNVVDARAEFSARALMTRVERKLAEHNQLDMYDVYAEWYDDEPDNIEIWLRDRSDDSRIGPVDFLAI